MPYKIQRVGSKYEVVVRDTGRVVGTHPSKNEAEAQLGALYANVPEASNKCMTCGCEDLGNDHHYISDTQKCSYCIEKGQGPCWEGYQYAGTKDKDGKKVPNCIPVKKESGGASRLAGGVGWSIEFNTPDCQHGWAVIKSGTGQSIGCYLSKEAAEEQLKALAHMESMTKSVADYMHQDPSQDGDDEMNFWNGAFSPFAHSRDDKEPLVPTYNSPPQKDGQESVGYGNRSGKNGRSNS